MDTVTIYLPGSTDVVVQGFTNAAYSQRITITPSNGAPVVFTGAGEANTPIGTTHFTTPSGTDVPLTVSIAHSKDNGRSWIPSDIYSDRCNVQALQLEVIVSEDLADEDYNDAVCFVSWPQSTGS